MIFATLLFILANLIAIAEDDYYWDDDEMRLPHKPNMNYLVLVTYKQLTNLNWTDIRVAVCNGAVFYGDVLATATCVKFLEELDQKDRSPTVLHKKNDKSDFTSHRVIGYLKHDNYQHKIMPNDISLYINNIGRLLIHPKIDTQYNPVIKPTDSSSWYIVHSENVFDSFMITVKLEEHKKCERVNYHGELTEVWSNHFCISGNWPEPCRELKTGQLISKDDSGVLVGTYC